jgi:hypothetical protein
MADIAATMRRQYGLITFEQAIAGGLTPHRIRSRVRRGEWIPVARRLYRPAVVPMTLEQRALGACRLAGADAMVSHMTAAVLHRLEGARPGRIEITVRRGRTHENALATVHQTSVLPGVARVGLIPVTPVARTLADLAGRLSEGHLLRMLDQALVHGKATSDGLRAAVDYLRRGLVVWTPGPRPGSVPEIQLARLIVDAGYPVPERQVEIFDADGRFVGRVDLALRAEHVALEYLGADGHNPRTEIPDRAREHDIRAAGWELITATKHTFGPGKARFLRALDAVIRAARAA